MRTPRECLSDDRIEQVIAIILRAGVLLAVGLVLAFGVCHLWRHATDLPRYSAFVGEPSEDRTIAGVVSGIRSGRCRSGIQFGLLVLVATPVLRVLFSLVAFAIQRDRLYTVIALFVLSVLLYSLAGPGV